MSDRPTQEMIKSARNHLRVASKWAYEEEDVDSVNFLMGILDDYERLRKIADHGCERESLSPHAAPVCAPELIDSVWKCRHGRPVRLACPECGSVEYSIVASPLPPSEE